MDDQSVLACLVLQSSTIYIGTIWQPDISFFVRETLNGEGGGGGGGTALGL